MQLKSSRCAEEEESNAFVALRNRVEASQVTKREVLASIGEDVRAVSRDTELVESRTLLDETQAAGRSLEKRHRVESAAFVVAHAKRCKLRTEADIAVTPSSIDWSISGATSLVKDQGQCKSCTEDG